MADHLQPYHEVLSDRALTEAYERLVNLIDRNQLKATFAFVMAFVLTPEERREFEPILGRDKGKGDAWLEPYWAQLEDGRTEGWHCPAAFDVVRSSSAQEIACHSFCHRPLGGTVDRAVAETELDAAHEAAELKQISLSTFVFPRNDVGNLPALRTHGYLGYRERLRRPSGMVGKMLALAAEFDTHPAPQPDPLPNGDPIPIPSGYFFNWRFGARRRIPKDVTIARWSNLLRRTAREGGVAHLWLHPHNLITGPGTFDVLERVLGEVADMQVKGELRVETQADYCRRLS